MSITTSNLAGACPAIVLGLQEIVTRNYSPSTPIGFLQLLRKPSNVGNFDDQVEYLKSRSGKTRQARVFYRQRATKSDIKATKDCNSVAERPPLEETVDIKLEAHHTITMSEEEVYKLCDAYQSWQQLPGQASMSVFTEMAMLVAQDYNAMREKINDLMLGQFVPYIGRYQGQAAPVAPATYTPKTFNMLNADRKSINALGVAQFIQEMRKMGFVGLPQIFGAGNIEIVNTYFAAGTGNDAGVNIGQINPGFDFALDYAVGTALGNADQVGIFMPGSLQMLSYNLYANLEASRREIGTKSRGLIPDPELGINYDISLMPDECEEAYTLKIDAYFDLWRRPMNQFKAGDRLEGVNGVVAANIAAA